MTVEISAGDEPVSIDDATEPGKQVGQIIVEARKLSRRRSVNDGDDN
jgi:hypothetical protein